MAIDSEGYNGEFTEVAAAHLSGLYLQPCVVGESSFAFSASVAGEDRTLRFTGGECYGYSIRGYADSTSDLAFNSVVSGVRYDTVAIRYDATSNTTALVVVEGGSSATVAAGLEDTPGTTVDDPIHLIRIDAGSTTATHAVDLREFHSHDGMRRFKTGAARDLRLTDPAPGQRITVGLLGAYEYRNNGAGVMGWNTAHDSGWINVSLHTEITAEAGLVPAVRRVGSHVTMRGRVKRINGADIFSATTLGTIPAGFRPSAAIYPAIGTAPKTAGSAAMLTIGSTGVLTPYLHVSVDWVSFDGISFYVD